MALCKEVKPSISPFELYIHVVYIVHVTGLYLSNIFCVYIA